MKKFKVGDYVKNSYGGVGRITDIHYGYLESDHCYECGRCSKGAKKQYTYSVELARFDSGFLPDSIQVSGFAGNPIYKTNELTKI